ncbi:MAG: Flp family type IVb pilin [Terricaulis sp.]|nr:Flp family type IVb pilin [Terricaulis sp.]
MLVSLKKFIANEDGATAIEYGLIAALVGVAIIAGVGALGDSLDTTFQNVSDELTANNTPAGGGGSN